MRGVRAVAALVALCFMTTPVRAGTDRHDLVFKAAPCGALCSDFAVTPLLGYRVCGTPFPSGYMDVVTEPAPASTNEGQVLLQFVLDPVIDWDAFVCAYPDVYVGDGGCLRGDGCGAPSECFSQPVGCRETVWVQTEPGRRYTLRAYNFNDPFNALGWYRWVNL